MSILITSVTPADKNGTATGSAVTNLTEPVSYMWRKTDLLNQSNGRMASMAYLKMLQGKLRNLEIEWKYRTYAETAVFLAAFDHEYVNVTYLDALTGTTATKHFVVGDMETGVFIDGSRWEYARVSLTQATPDGV